MKEMFECALCGEVNAVRPWSPFVDLCDKCYTETRAAMTPEDRKRWQGIDWDLLADDLDSTYGPDMPRDEWANAYEWDFTQAVTR